METGREVAISYTISKDVAKGIRLLRQTLVETERILGTGHPLTQAVRENLALARSPRNRGKR